VVALTLAIGSLLTATGVIAWFVTSMSSITALIPAFVGVLLLVTWLIARRGEGARRHAMHAAMVVALLGALGSLMNVAKIGSLIDGTAERPAAIVVSLIMFVALVVYLVLGIRSFVQARKARTATSA
jgi:cytochrome bd-type quinol oxidase subunit 2